MQLRHKLLHRTGLRSGRHQLNAIPDLSKLRQAPRSQEPRDRTLLFQRRLLESRKLLNIHSSRTLSTVVLVRKSNRASVLERGRLRSRWEPNLLAEVAGFAILSAHLRTPAKPPSVCWTVRLGSQREKRGHLEKHFRWESQLQHFGR